MLDMRELERRQLARIFAIASLCVLAEGRLNKVATHGKFASGCVSSFEPIALKGEEPDEDAPRTQ